MLDGVKVIVLPVEYSHYYPFSQRIRTFLKFVFYSCQEIIHHEADLVYATSTPLTIAIPAIWYKFRKKVPFVLEIRDIWPDAALVLGAVKKGLVYNFLQFIEKYAYEQSIGMVALSPDIKNHIHSIAPYKDVEVIPNIAQTDFFYPRTKYSKAPYLISYLGTVGSANSLESFIPFLKELESLYPAQFELVIMGEGKMLDPFLKKLCSGSSVINHKVLPKDSKEAVKELLQKSSFTLVSFHNHPVLAAGCPNKFFDSLAAGVPVILNFDGWLHKKVLDYRLGLVLNSNCEVRTAHKLMAICRNQDAWQELSDNCQSAAINYTPKKAGNNLMEFLKGLKK
jgi:glycosyltransferase involved in cell wall biosynthesis